MKYLFSAIALVIASPALAQTAPAPQQDHAQHQQHGQGQHQQHGQGQHQQHGPGQHQPGQHCCCCADRNNDGRMDCCERHQAESEHQGH